MCFRNNEKRTSSFQWTTAQLFQKQNLHVGSMALIKIQTIFVTVITGFNND